MKRYVILEQTIPYDWDDYYVWVSNYYDTQDKKVVEYYFGHGTHDELAKEAMSLKDALEQGISEDDIRLAIINRLSFGHQVNLYTKTKYNIPCTVKGSRKLNGKLIIIGFERTVDEWATSRSYRGTVYTEKYVVYEPSTNRLARVSRKHVTFDVDFKTIFLNGCKEVNIPTLAHLIAYSQSYAACDSDNYNIGVNKILNLGLISTYGECDTEMAVDPWELKKEEKRKAKIKAKQDAARPDIERWANQKFPDMTPEEREKIIQRTLDKHYS